MIIAVVGAFGQMGEACLYDLCMSAEVKKIYAADLHITRAKAVLSRLPNRRKIQVVQLDMKAPDAARKLKGTGAVINCAWYELNLAGMQLALALKAHYVDLGGLYHMTLRQLKLSGAYKKTGRSAVLGCGSTPGITNMMAERIVRRLDRVETVGIYDAGYDPDMEGRENWIPPFSIRTMLDEYQMPTPILVNGKLRMDPAFTHEEEVAFPAPFGRGVAGACIHSELATLPEAYKSKGVKNVFFKIVYPQSVKNQLKMLVGMGLDSAEPVRVNGSSVAPRDLITALAQKSVLEASGTPKDVEILRVVAHGEEGGRKTSLTFDCFIRYKHGLSAGAIGVGFPASIAAQLLLKGGLKPGAFAPEGVLPVEPFFKELGRRKTFDFLESVTRPAAIAKG